MKKIITSYLAGIFTALFSLAVLNTLTQMKVSRAFDSWIQMREEKVVSTIKSDAGLVAVLNNTGPRAEENKNDRSSRWNEKRIVLTPDEKMTVYIDVELKDGKWNRIQVYDGNSHKQVTVGLDGDNQFQWTQIFGDGHMSSDKNFDGLIDMYADWPPQMGGDIKSRLFYVTDDGIVDGVFGGSFTKETSDKQYRLTWNGSTWIKEYRK